MAEAQLAPPQHLIAEAFEQISKVKLLDENGDVVGKGIMGYDQEMYDQIYQALSEAYTRGIDVGATAKASNGIAIPTQAEIGATLTLSTEVGASMDGPSGSGGAEISKEVRSQFQLASGAAINKDIDARSENTKTVQRLAGSLQDRQVTVTTRQGVTTSIANHAFFNKEVGRQVDLMYRRAVNMSYASTPPPAIAPQRRQ